MASLSPSSSRSTRASPSQSITRLNPPDFEYEKVNEFCELTPSRFYSSPPEFQYSASEATLPPPLNNKPGLAGNGIFFFSGDPGIPNQAILKDFSSVKNSAPAYLYVKYYAHISQPAPDNGDQGELNIVVGKAYVGPAAEPDVDQIKYLPITRDFKWTEALIELNIAEASSNYGIAFGAMEMAKGDYFLIERFALIYGNDSPSLEVIRTLFQPVIPEEIPEESSCCCSVWRCIMFPIALILNIILWPLIWCCCPGKNDKEERDRYQRYE